MSATRIQFPLNLARAERLLKESIGAQPSAEERKRITSDPIVRSLVKIATIQILMGTDPVAITMAAVVASLDLGYSLAMDELREQNGTVH